MENITRTVYAAYVQTCLFLNTSPAYPTNSTLNEKLNINAGVIPAGSDRPSLAAYCIGNKGHQGVSGTEGIFKTEPVQHRATDASLYGQLPFVLRPINNDLSQADRAKYCLRLEEIHDNVRYAAYYGRRIDKTNVVPQMLLKNVTNGVETTQPFVPNSSNQNPTPPQIASTGVNTTDGSYVQAVAALTLSITESDAAEFLNVAKVIYGDESYAIISEIALVMGVDKVVQVTSTAGNFQMNELIGAQIAAFSPAMVPVNFNPTGVDISLNVGATEPLLNLSN
jgi:hypothetical protein